MPLNILNKKVTGISDLQGSGSWFSSESSKGEDTEREIREEYLHLHLDNQLLKTMIYKWPEEMNEIHPRGTVNNKRARRLSSVSCSPHSSGWEMVKLQP